jgi:hypothetical protein
MNAFQTTGLRMHGIALQAPVRLYWLTTYESPDCRYQGVHATVTDDQVAATTAVDKSTTLPMVSDGPSGSK